MTTQDDQTQQTPRQDEPAETPSIAEAENGQAIPADGAAEDPAAKAQEYLNLLLRTRADFTNYRRRVEEERAQWVRDSTLGLVQKLLPILDDFERALGSVSPDDLDTPWGRGVQLIERNLRSLLTSEDVHRVDAQGVEFNPWEHEAVSYVSSADADDGTVLHVVRPGYRKGDKIIRPAQVVVAKRPDA